MQMSKSLIKCFLILIILCFPFRKIFSQESASILDQEAVKIQEDFMEADGNEAIPKSELIDELLKPENADLLEQLKTGDITSPEELKLGKEKLNEKDTNEEKTDTEEENADEDDEKDDKKQKIPTYGDEDFLGNDVSKYYQSIKEFFGYSVFLIDFKVDLSSLPVNPNYIIGPGDVFRLSLWGDTVLNADIFVNNEGTVDIPGVGIVAVHGMTASDLEVRMKKILSKHYNTIDPPNGKATTFFDIYFTKMRPITVFINGEVVSPGAYSIPQRASIISALILAKGITARGTLRSIKVVRNGEKTQEVDLYDFLVKGKGVEELNLRDNDNIFVGTRLSTVSLKGEVMRPLKYELKKGETLEHLIEYSGGLLPTSSIDRVRIERLMPFEERKTAVALSSVLDPEFTKIDENNELKILPVKLFDHDIVEVFTIPRILTDYLAINGSVYRKGRYSFEKGMKLGDLINKAGGLLSDAYTERIELVRTYIDARSEYFNLNLNSDREFELFSRDSINIYSQWSLKSRNYVIINGFIKNPGFQILSDSTKLSDLIFSKGGIEDKYRKDRTYLLRAELTRFNEDGLTTRLIYINLRKMLDGDRSEDILLQDGDQIRIYDMNIVFTEPKVSISGYVKSENEYPMSTNMTVEDLILKARGFREGAFKYKAIVFRKSNMSENSDLMSSVFEIDLDPDFLTNNNYKRSTFILEHQDHVVIRRNPNYNELMKVQLAGEVKFPGVYTIIKRSETLRDVIERAGGLTDNAFIDGTQFVRDTTRIVTDFKKAIAGSAKNDIILKDKDEILIPDHPGTVYVEGYVYTPGSTKYRSDWDVEDYIEAAGGVKREKNYTSGDAVVYYPGGNAKVDNGWFFTPQVKEGSRIVVPKIEADPDVQWAAEIRTWMGVLVSALTVVVLVNAVQ